jgi:hypothetical protein
MTEPATRERLRVDMAELTFREMYELNLFLGMTFADALQGIEQPRAMAAAVWILERRRNPDYTFDDAFDLAMQRDIEIVNEDGDAGKVDAPSNGDTPPALLASGA